MYKPVFSTQLIRNNIPITGHAGDVMAEVLLRELSNADIDWMINAGHRETIESDRILVELCKQPDEIHLLLDGTLAIVIPLADQVSGKLSAPKADGCGNYEVMRLSSGEIVGELSLFNLCLMPAVAKAISPSLVLSIPRQQLVEKLEQDISFSSRFYRMIALMLSERLRRLLEMPGQIQATTDQAMKEVLFVFGEFRDSDVDWLVAAGEVKTLSAGSILLQTGKPVDALHIVLDGLLQISAPEGKYNPLTLCFECAEKNAKFEKPIATLSKGEVSGAVSFLDFRPHPTMVRAINNSLVLSIPRQVLSMRLQQDISFASRFYRVLAIQIANSLQAVMNQLGCSQTIYTQHQEMDMNVEYDDELDLDSLHQVSQGAARFNWMLKRLGIV